MAEGGDDFAYKDPDLDKKLDNDNDTTQPFEPLTRSTPYQPGAPYHEGEQMEMSSMWHEQSSLPDTSYAETSFLGEDIPLLEPDFEREFVIDRLKSIYQL